MENHRSILLIGNFLSSSVGTRGISEDLREQLGMHGWKVYYASSRMNKITRILDMLLVIIRFRNIVNVVNIEVFSGASFIWAEMCAYVLSVLRKPFILSLHGGNLPVFYIRWPSRVQRLLQAANSVVTPSNYLRNAFSLIRKDIMLIPNGIHIDRYPYVERKLAKPSLIWLRAIHEIYNPLMAVETIKDLVSDYPDVKLLMVGPDKNDGTYQALLEKITNYNLQENISLPGWISKNEVPEYMNKGDIFINTTNIESFGVSVLEAAACGLPIVTTNVGELAFFWENGLDAMLVPLNDPQAMAAAVRRILTEPNLAEKLSRNARKKAEGFDWSVILPQWEELFKSIAKI